jgi:hypothetical protein
MRRRGGGMARAPSAAVPRGRHCLARVPARLRHAAGIAWRGSQRGCAARPALPGAGPSAGVPRSRHCPARVPARLCRAAGIAWRGSQRGCAARPALPGAGPSAGVPRSRHCLERVPARLRRAAGIAWRGSQRGCAARPAWRREVLDTPGSALALPGGGLKPVPRDGRDDRTRAPHPGRADEEARVRGAAAVRAGWARAGGDNWG